MVHFYGVDLTGGRAVLMSRGRLGLGMVLETCCDIDTYAERDARYKNSGTIPG